MRIGLLCSRLRVEEKQLLAACAARGLGVEVIDEARLRFDLSDRRRNGFDVVLERSADPWRAAYALRLLENMGLCCINRYAVAETCSNKLLATAALAEAGVPHPRTMVAFEIDEALAAAEALGYPVLFKPAIGTWEHLLGKANDRQAAEAILEHKQVLGTYHHTIFYVQEYVAKPGRDLRVLVAGAHVVGAVYRQTGHWSAEMARDLTLVPCALTPAVEALARQAAAAVGGGVLAVDLVEDPQRGPLVIEVGPVQEFRQVAKATGVDVAGAIVDYVAAVARGELAAPAAGSGSAV
jgi:[lysine-biosynthesis-protein LysW]--L-2-aminoadipate ligase